VTTILSIQSSVAYGHAGNSAATFPLMRAGIEVWPVLTVHFSNHTAYPTWRGPLLSAQDVADVIHGIDERGVLSRCDAVLSGYQGGPDIAHVVLQAVELVRRRNPAVVYCCDPVMGDIGRGFFVRPGIPELMRDRVVPAAQVVTPNQFELEYLTGHSATTRHALLEAVDALREVGPRTVLVTSAVLEDVGPDTISMVAVDEHGAWQVTTPRLPRTFTGSGDVTAALFLAHLLRGGVHPPVSGGGVPTALAATAASVYGLLAATAASGHAELQLVAAQEEFVRPTHQFEVLRLR
jgi:pyridoxine kinase